MKKVLLFILSSFLLNNTYAQNLYSKAFGNASKPAVIYLHYGPDGSSALFEASTAQALADKGLYVIVYDRRGQGKSAKLKAKYTLEQSVEDLKLIYETYKINKAMLIGDGFGGILAYEFAKNHPAFVKSIVLSNTPFTVKEQCNNIITKAVNINKELKNEALSKKINELGKIDSNSAAYYTKSLALAKKFDINKAKAVSDNANILNNELEDNIELQKQLKADSTFIATEGFMQDKVYTTFNMMNYFKPIKKENIKLYALYGKEDASLSNEHKDALTEMCEQDKCSFMDECGQYIFIDEQQTFLIALYKWNK
jgi:proline iminopeptidase